MLPMAYAPGLPAPRDRVAWLAASPAALAFWDRAMREPRISARFRAVCAANLKELGRLSKLA